MPMRKRKEVQEMLRQTFGSEPRSGERSTKYTVITNEQLENLEKLDLITGDNLPTGMKPIAGAAEILRSGGLVAFPTETVYGLGANALDKVAVKRIYEAKGRPSDNPLIIHIASIDDLNGLVKKIPPVAETLMRAFWPGPLTLVFEKSESVPYETSGGLDTVAVRFPKNKVARLLIKQAGIPVAAPSANSSGKPSPTRAEHVLYDLNGKIDMIIDGGDCELGLESTVLDVSGGKAALLRPGSVTKEMIEALIGEIDVDQSSGKPKSPGMKYRHYAPKARVTLYEGAFPDIAFCINRDLKRTDKKVGVLASVQGAKLYDIGENFAACAEVLVVGDRERPETVAANLFRLLRKFDNIGVEEIYAESFEQINVGAAVMNRLKKAAGGRIRRCAVKRVIFVCSGNTCRSPMAEALAKKMFWDEDIIFISRGIRAMNDMPVSANARQTLSEKYGIDLSNHLSALLTEEDLREADLVLTMTAAHKRAIENEHPGHNNIELLMGYTLGMNKDIADPFGGDLKQYMDCAAQIQSCLKELLKKEGFLC